MGHDCYICEALDSCGCEPKRHNWQGIYGAWVFFLLHADSKREFAKQNALQDCLSRVQHSNGLFGDAAPWGRVVSNLPEARRVYLALCERFDRQQENIL